MARGVPSIARRVGLASGDILIYLLSTLAGFASHQELGLAAAGRMLATWVPFTVSWLAIAPWLGLHRPEVASDIRSLGRVALAALCAAPLGAWLRGLWLGTRVIPVFVLVMASVTAAAMLLWRLLYAVTARRGGAGTASRG